MAVERSWRNVGGFGGQFNSPPCFCMLSDRQIDHSDKNMMRWALDKNMTSAWCAIRMRWAGFCFATLRPTLGTYGSHSRIDLSDLPTALSSGNELSPWHCSLIFWERQATVEASDIGILTTAAAIFRTFCFSTGADIKVYQGDSCAGSHHST